MVCTDVFTSARTIYYTLQLYEGAPSTSCNKNGLRAFTTHFARGASPCPRVFVIDRMNEIAARLILAKIKN
jgi:hypothetical protein